MFYYISHKYKYIIILFAKSGCSTLRYLFTQLHHDEFNDPLFIKNKNIYGLTHVNTWGNYSYNHIINNPLNKNFIISDKYKDYKKICVVRNTYQRVVSSYFNQFLELNVEQGACIVKNEKSFNYFINIIETINNFHYYPQKIIDKVDKYIFLENIKELYDFYKDIIKLPIEKLLIVDNNIIKKNIKLECMKKMHYRDNLCLSNYNFLKDINSLCIQLNGVPHYKNMYNEEILNIIKTKYKYEIDLHNFKYD